MKKFFIVTGWLGLIAFPLYLNDYFVKGRVLTKWGEFSDLPARDALIGYSIITLLFGGYAIYHSFNYIIQNKDKILNSSFFKDNYKE